MKKSLEVLKKLIKKLLILSLLSVVQSDNKSLVAIVIKQVFEQSLKRTG